MRLAPKTRRTSSSSTSHWLIEREDIRLLDRECSQKSKLLTWSSSTDFGPQSPQMTSFSLKFNIELLCVTSWAINYWEFDYQQKIWRVIAILWNKYKPSLPMLARLFLSPNCLVSKRSYNIGIFFPYNFNAKFCCASVEHIIPVRTFIFGGRIKRTHDVFAVWFDIEFKRRSLIFFLAFFKKTHKAVMVRRHFIKNL